ncbi:MAG TPA: ribose 5-phosphate isomerase B [Candidatus Krumholzibacteria bacterium]|nr:ribose 5-phosphate isomerase B [Candidatus Krumholzibacteria bacterium]
MRLDEIQEQLRAQRRGARRRTGKGPDLCVALGSDHGGFELKERLRAALVARGIAIEDCGTHDTRAVDYPDIAVAVARRVTSGACSCGIVVDGIGIGSCMAANKVEGIRAATCHDEMTVRNSREHNDANVLVLGSRVLHPGFAKRLVFLWLRTPFSGGRHALRVAKIDALDRGRHDARAREPDRPQT